MVTHLDDYRPCILSEVICVKCYHRYLCVRPLGVLLKDLVCDKCGVGFIVETGETNFDNSTLEN